MTALCKGVEAQVWYVTVGAGKKGQQRSVSLFCALPCEPPLSRALSGCFATANTYAGEQTRAAGVVHILPCYGDLYASQQLPWEFFAYTPFVKDTSVEEASAHGRLPSTCTTNCKYRGLPAYLGGKKWVPYARAWCHHFDLRYA